MMFIFHQRNHLGQSIICQLEHLMNMIILFRSEIHITPMLTINCTCQIITAVTNTLYFSHLTKHSTNLQLTLRTQTPVGYLIQIISNLHLHIITYILIFLNTAEQFVKVIVIRGMKQIPHHAKHTMSTLCKEIDFLACLQYRKLCRRKHTTCNKAQTIFLILLSLRNDFTNSFLYQLDKPNKNQHIAYIKSSMKSRQFKRYGNSRICCSHYIFYKP